MYILAHDLGTSGNKATLFDESGLLIASRTAAYPTDYASGNRAEQNPHHWWKAIVDTTQALLELVSPNDIAGVALSGQMMGCLCVDKDGNPLTVEDTISSPVDLAEDLEKKIQWEKVSRIIEKMPNGREKEIIVLRYGLNNKKPLTQREIAQRLKISRSYVSRIEKKVLTDIKNEID